MSKELEKKIIEEVSSEEYDPKKPRQLARSLDAHIDENYPAFREALRALMDEGRVAIGASGTIILPTRRSGKGGDEIEGTYRHNKRGFGFVIPSDPTSHEDLFIPEGSNTAGAMSSDIVRAKITSRSHRDGKMMLTGKILEVLTRKNKRFVGSLTRTGGLWFVVPDGNTYTDRIFTPDAATKYLKPGTKVVVEITTFPDGDESAQGVITEVLGAEGDKDVDLKTVIVGHNLPEDFPDEVKDQASSAVSGFNLEEASENRYDMTDEIICTIDPDDAKDYDDAISLKKTDDGYWELGVHIADVSYFVQTGTPLDVEAAERGNSTYFPGHVIPMLPEVLSNGICSLQEGVPRLCKSAFIVYDEFAKPIRSRFSNTVIKSRQRLRYKEAQAILDGLVEIPHPNGARKVTDYDPEVISLLRDMDTLARRIQKRRNAAGQLVLTLPEVELVLDENGQVVDAVPEDTSFTHTLIEMFMVEANEAVARLLDSIGVPFLRRTHPEPDEKASERLKHFVTVAGYPMPEIVDRIAVQQLLERVKGKPEAFAINLAVLRSLTRAEYSPKNIGHFALASTHYAHFTSPIRRYADLTIHRLLDAYFEAARLSFKNGPAPRLKGKVHMENVPTMQDCEATGKHISMTERRSEAAERELRQVKILQLMTKHVGEEFTGVVTGITNFGLFIQLQAYLVDGLVRYEALLDDWWDVDEKAGMIRGQRTGQKIRIGDVVKVRVARVDMARRELDLSVLEVLTRGTGGEKLKKPEPKKPGQFPLQKQRKPEGSQRRNQKSKNRDRKKWKK